MNCAANGGGVTPTESRRSRRRPMLNQQPARLRDAGLTPTMVGRRSSRSASKGASRCVSISVNGTCDMQVRLWITCGVGAQNTLTRNARTNMRGAHGQWPAGGSRRRNGAHSAELTADAALLAERRRVYRLITSSRSQRVGPTQQRIFSPSAGRVTPAREFRSSITAPWCNQRCCDLTGLRLPGITRRRTHAYAS